MEKKLYDAFEMMTKDADPAKVQAAVHAKIDGEQQKSRYIPGKKIRRIAAACAAVLVLSVTVYAVVTGTVSVFIPENAGDGYVVRMGNDPDTVAKLSRKQAEVLKPYAGDAMPFDTWADAAEWLDCGVLISDLLDTGTDVELKPLFRDDGTLGNVCLSGSFTMTDGEVSVSILTNILQERWKGLVLTMGDVTVEMDTDGQITFSGDGTESIYTTETYTTSSGITMSIVYKPTWWLEEDGWTDDEQTCQYWQSAGHAITEKWNTEIFFTHNGIVYQIGLRYLPAESAPELAKTMADSLVSSKK